MGWVHFFFVLGLPLVLTSRWIELLAWFLAMLAPFLCLVAILGGWSLYLFGHGACIIFPPACGSRLFYPRHSFIPLLACSLILPLF